MVNRNRIPWLMGLFTAIVVLIALVILVVIVLRSRKEDARAAVTP